MTEMSSCGDVPVGGWVSASMSFNRVLGDVPFYMIDFEFSTPLYLTNAETNLTANGNFYNRFPFAVENVKNLTGPTPKNVRVGVANIDRSIATAVMSEAVQGKQCTIWKAYWTGSAMTSPYIHFQGHIDMVEIREDQNTAQILFEMKNDFVRWDKDIPYNQYSINCNWVFKSTTPGCQYVGVQSLCDKSYKTCNNLGNTERFRGFRYMSELEDKEIWWGKARASG